MWVLFHATRRRMRDVTLVHAKTQRKEMKIQLNNQGAKSTFFAPLLFLASLREKKLVAPLRIRRAVGETKP